MSRRMPTDVRAEQSGQDTSAGLVRAHLLAADVARPKRIDRYIDYFGSGGPRPIGVTLDPCGESLLDAAEERRVDADRRWRRW